MEVMTFRLDDAEIKILEERCRKNGKSRAAMLQEIVERDLRGDVAPSPAPAPAPVPLGGGSETPQPLAGMIVYLLDDCREQKRREDRIVLRQTLNWYWPKLAAIFVLFGSRSALHPEVGRWPLLIAEGLIFFDMLWQGRELGAMNASRASAGLQKLIDEIPKAWDAGCRVKSPAAVELELIAMIKDRRDRIAAYGVKDLGGKK